MNNNIKDLYVAGMLHDIGKYVHKYNGRKASHCIMSQLFVLNNPKICIGSNSDKIANIVAKHHDDANIPKDGTIISPYQKVSSEIIKKASENYKINSYEDIIDIIRLADSLSASSDRASEISDNKGTSAPYAPLLSTIGKLLNRRLTVRHGNIYEVYEYTGNDDKKETVEILDKDCTQHIEASFKSFMSEIEHINSLDELDDLLKEYWFTVNANTWRPEGESLGNTTTSLYDHSKTTAAIAVSIYINKLHNHHPESAIDILHITYNGINISIENEITNIIDKYDLCKINIICATDNEVYIMIPSSITQDFIKEIKNINKDSFMEYGETIDYEIATNWQFKNCRTTFSDRISYSHCGILDVINDIKPRISDDTSDYVSKRLCGKVIAGYNVEGYSYIINKITSENDSISKVSTTFRIFEKFNHDVIEYLNKNKCDILVSGLYSCIYATDYDKVHQIEKEITRIYSKYVANTIGLYFTYMKYDKYTDTINHIKNDLETRQNSLDIVDKLDNNKIIDSTIKIHNKRYKISAINRYEEYLSMMQGIEKSLLNKIKALYINNLQYDSTKDTLYLISKSRMNYLYNQTDENDTRQRDLIKRAYEYMYDTDKNKIPDQALILYEALKASTSKGE